MGYLSNVRFKLLKNDYEELVKNFEKERQSVKEEVQRLELLKEQATTKEEKDNIQGQIWKANGMSDLFCIDKKDCWADLIKKEKKEVIYGKYIPEEERYEKTEVDIVYFGWNGLKWYDGYKDVDFIMDFVRSRDIYAYSRTGEETGDIEEESQELDCIYVYTAFEEDDE